jgi:hypothetical protein
MRWKWNGWAWVFVIVAFMPSAGAVSAAYVDVREYDLFLFRSANAETFTIVVNVSTPHGLPVLARASTFHILDECEFEAPLLGSDVCQFNLKLNGTLVAKPGSDACLWSLGHERGAGLGVAQRHAYVACANATGVHDGVHNLTVTTFLAPDLGRHVSVILRQTDTVQLSGEASLAEESVTIAMDWTPIVWLLWVVYAALVFRVKGVTQSRLLLVPGFIGVFLLPSGSVEFPVLLMLQLGLSFWIVSRTGQDAYRGR